MYWFKYFIKIDGLNTDNDVQTFSLSENIKYKDKIRQYLSNIGVGLFDIEVDAKDFEESQLPDSLDENLRSQLTRRLMGSKSYHVNALHKTYKSDGTLSEKFVNWDFNDRESAGTQKAFKLCGPILWVLANGGVLIIDEIEAALHPIMTLATIELFLNNASNPNNSQLIFATHDTNLLSYSNLRRDQIYFAEKNKLGKY